MAFPLANGPGFTLQILALPTRDGLLSLWVFRCNLTRPPRTIAKINFTRHHDFFQGFPGGYSQ
jgi:hypothetical protein